MRFLGNKTRMLENIEFVIRDNSISAVTFCDLFAGSGAVSDYFKDRYVVTANDYLQCLSVITRAKLEFSYTPKFDDFVSKFGVDPFEYFNSKQYSADSQFFITNNYSPKANRQYFSTENAIKIDGIRIDIEELYKDLVISGSERNFLLASLIESVMGVSNTTGTYEAFLKIWDKRALKPFILAPLSLSNKPTIGANKVFNKDSNELVREVSGDILYIDPPYTITDYSAAYHLLETIVKYDTPIIAGKTGRRRDNGVKSKYTKKELALRNLEDLFRQANFKHIILSYSTQGLVSLSELEELAKKFALNGKVSVYRFPYREYKNIRSSKKGANLQEIILYFEKDITTIRSPLNYTGSKYGIFKDIQRVFPKHISTFVDMMGGAFNVGVNVVAEKVIYNEFLPHTYQIISFLLKDDKASIIHTVEQIISAFHLQKGDKSSYLALREDYNRTRDIYKLFVLHMYCFQNQMRFNANLDFNTPVGNCSYNETLIERIESFIPQTPDFELHNGSYMDLDMSDFDKDTLFYFDPPYFITSATYNDGRRGFVGWNADEEVRLLEFITFLHENGFKFILSNVIYHNDSTNHILAEWIKTHDFIVKNLDNVGAKNSRDEVLITNYDWRYT